MNGKSSFRATLCALLGFASLVVADPAKLPDPPKHKPIEVEVRHMSELAEVTMRGMKSVPKVATAVEFVANTLSAYRAFRLAGKGARFGGTMLSKVSPAGPFLTAWFAMNAPLEIAEHRLNKRIANAALTEAIDKVDRLLSLNDAGVTIIYDGKRYTRDEVLHHFRTLQKDLMTADPTWGEGLKEAVKAAIPIPFLFENDTAMREHHSACAQLILAQAIQDVIAATAPEIIEKARLARGEVTFKYMTKIGEDLRRNYFEGLKCHIFVTCHEAGLEWDKHNQELHGRKATVAIPTWTDAQDPRGERRYRAMLAVLMQGSATSRQNWGCVSNEHFGRLDDAKDVAAKNQTRVFSSYAEPKYLGSETLISAHETLRAVHRACGDVKKWDGHYFISFSTYEVLGHELYRTPFEGKDSLRVLFQDFMMANPEMPDVMSKSASNPNNWQFQGFLPKPPEPPQMRARR